MTKRPHVVTLWNYLSRFFFLLIVPLLQAVFRAPFSEVAWSSLPGVVAVVGISCFQYLSCEYGFTAVEENGHSLSILYWNSGLFFQKHRILPADCVASVFLRLNPVLDLFGAAQVMLDSPAANAKRPSLTLLLKKKAPMAWWDELRGEITHRYKASPVRVVLMAISWSNPASGLLLIGILLDRAGKLLGEELTRQLYGIYESVNQVQRLIAWGLPPAVAIIGWLMGLGWFCAFLVQFFRYAFFTAGVCPTGTMISRGMLVRSRQLLTNQAIRAVAIRQTLVMRLMHLSSVYLHTIGSGKEKGDRSLLMAAANTRELRYHLAHFYPKESSYFFSREGMKLIRPPKNTLMSFLLVPLLHASAIITLYLLFVRYLPLFSPLVLFLLAFPLYHLLLRTAAYRNSFLAEDNTHIAACSYVSDQLFTAVIPKSAVQAVVIRQNPLQQRSGRCSVRLCIGTEKGACFDLRHFRLSDVEQLSFTPEKTERQ
ncbi:YdbT family protein [Faecalispora anaeroviscerum]|uniref:PH domain protein n=1 Tax=Faecalispora anaeroviscerum TaxID=2991836 RepID=UPI0024B91E6A|nr:PH domain protein [Faecalispora anaeroviscerum]